MDNQNQKLGQNDQGSQGSKRQHGGSQKPGQAKDSHQGSKQNQNDQGHDSHRPGGQGQGGG